jgi:hypothetical protein
MQNSHRRRYYLEIFGGYAMETGLSPIGLCAVVVTLPERQVVEGAFFQSEQKSKERGEYFDIYHLMYRIRPPPRPP